jgi:PAS domain S-box-containing protein
MRRKRASGKRRSPTHRLRTRLHEAEATLDAIRSGAVDAVVVSGPAGDRTRTFEGATHPYHVLLNAMNDGAALLNRDGTILFGNRRLAEIAHAALERLRGSRFPQLVAPADRPSVEAFVRQGRTGGAEFAIVGTDSSATPVWIAFSRVPLDASLREDGTAGNGATVLMAIITDLTDRKRAETTQRALLQRLLTAEDQERGRIARELHDETGQSLTTLLVGLRAIGDKTGLAEVRSMAERLREVAAHTVDDVGRLARGLHPAILDDKGLVAAMRRHVSDFAKAFGVVVNLRVGAVPRRTAPLAQSTVYRILQEALTNVARHAQARVVGVVLKRENSVLELVIRDDGVGFDPAAALSEASGLGLHGMQQRVALLGGSVEIESRRGHGTVIRARVPAEIAGPP